MRKEVRKKRTMGREREREWYWARWSVQTFRGYVSRDWASGEETTEEIVGDTHGQNLTGNFETKCPGPCSPAERSDGCPCKEIQMSFQVLKSWSV